MDITTQVSAKILRNYDSYISEFKNITLKARQRFEKREWAAMQNDSKVRLNLYPNIMQRLIPEVKAMLGDKVTDKSLWQKIKADYKAKIRNYPDVELTETFYNSICRKLFTGIPVDNSILFIYSNIDRYKFHSTKPIYKTYPGNIPLKDIIRNILLDYQPFVPPYEDLERDISRIAQRIKRYLLSVYRPDTNTRTEILKSVLFRNKVAYIVGRTFFGDTIIPFVLPFLNRENGVFIDTFIHNPDDVSTIFSFTRAYFFVDVRIPSEFVSFLKTLIPNKTLGELYHSIGFNKHGKTETYRELMQYLNSNNEKFVIAPGVRGMVMSVFTLPSYNFVFKLIKDKFTPPKNTTKAHVKAQYKLVTEHDRVGRMADTDEFENFEFDRSRFSSELLEELLEVAPSIVEVKETTVKIKHLYVERKMIPLNIYIEQASDDDIREIIIDYGYAIKELAAANIFPGDMLLKNFGVTRHKRVVFYDYDEISLITDLRFRRFPEPLHEDDAMASTPRFSVGPNDVFPEEFRQFIFSSEKCLRYFEEKHAGLFSPKYWREIQKRIRAGEIVDVFPYWKSGRFPRKEEKKLIQ